MTGIVAVVAIVCATFLIALVLQYVFARGLGWLPLDGFGTTLGEHARCLVLPALTLGIYGAAYYPRLVRDEVLDEICGWLASRAPALPARGAAGCSTS